MKCTLCKKPVPIQQSAYDDDGNLYHPECLMDTMSGEEYPEAPDMTERPRCGEWTPADGSGCESCGADVPL